MKNLFLLIICTLPALTATGQTVEFFVNEVEGLEKTFVLQGTFGQSTAVKNVWLYNRTQQRLRVYARPHVDGNALYFNDNKGVTSREHSLEIAPGTKVALCLFGFLDQGSSRTCRGHIALAATPLKADGSKGSTRTVKLPVVLNFEGATSTTAAKPAASTVQKFSKPYRYETITHQGVPMRWHLRQLPLKVYSSHTYTGDTASQYASVVRRVVEVWNNVGRENGMNRDFFKIVQVRGQADIRLDWTGTRLLPSMHGKAYPSDGLVGMWPLDHYRGLGRAGETLLHELCHMLGVAHSMVWEDIMFEGSHGSNPVLSKLGVTARDRQMLGWLYSQTRYVSFRD